MNAGMILMICGGASTVIGLIMAVAEAILEPKRNLSVHTDLSTIRRINTF